MDNQSRLLAQEIDKQKESRLCVVCQVSEGQTLSDIFSQCRVGPLTSALDEELCPLFSVFSGG